MTPRMSWLAPCCLLLAGCALLPTEGRSVQGPSSVSLPPLDPGVVAVGHVRRKEQELTDSISLAIGGAWLGSLIGTENVKRGVRVGDERGQNHPARQRVFVGYRGPGLHAWRRLDSAGVLRSSHEADGQGLPWALVRPPDQQLTHPKTRQRPDGPFVPLERLP